MVAMFVANVTKQDFTFHYRATGRTGVTSQDIPMGKQIRLSGDLIPDDVEGIILQHEKYGFVEMDRYNVPTFGGLIYSTVKPIPEAKIKRAMVKYLELQDLKGQMVRKDAAVAAAQVIDKEVVGEDNPLMKMTNLEMSAAEDAPSGGNADGHSLFSEGVQVLKVPPSEGPSSPIPGRSRRAA
jgi:hypothetical protein